MKKFGIIIIAFIAMISIVWFIVDAGSKEQNPTKSTQTEELSSECEQECASECPAQSAESGCMRDCVTKCEEGKSTADTTATAKKTCPHSSASK